MPSPRPSVFDLLADLAITRGRRVLGVAALLGVLAMPWAAGVFGGLGTGGLYAPNSSAARAERLLDDDFPGAPPNIAVEIVARSSIDEATPAGLGRELSEQLAHEPGVAGLVSYWTTAGAKPLLRAKDGDSGLILFRLGGSEDEIQRRLSQLHDKYAYTGPGVQVRFGGAPAVLRDVTEHSRRDLQRAELVTAPLVFLVLLAAFGGVVPAMLPILVGGSTVVASLALLRLMARLTYISVFSINLITALGFALAVDYSLFILRRFREERDRGQPDALALRTSLRTAGRTVLFSGLTVALSLTGALLLPLPYLRSYAYAGVGVVLASELAALLLLPAAIMLLGRRLDRGRRRATGGTGWATGEQGGAHRPRFGGGPAGGSAGARWSALAEKVMARPVLVACAAIGFMLLLAAPTLHLKVALADDTILPATAESHEVADALRTEYPVCLPCQIPIVVPGVDAREKPVADRLAAYARALSTVPGVARVDTASGSYAAGSQIAPAPPDGGAFLGSHGGAWLSLWPSDPEPVSDSARDMVRLVWALPAPYSVDVGGLAPHLLESRDAVVHSLPGAVAVVVAATFVLLFLFTGSVLLPLKALALNALNMAAVLGTMVLIFQDGHLRWLFGDFEVSGTIELTTPVLIFCIAFGLSMDYEVFLLARIREEYLRGGDNRAAVARGLGATGPMLSYAGLAVIVVMVGVATSQISIVTMVGVGMALAVFLDITIVRALLVPAIMALAGGLNWWAPAPLRRLHARFGAREDSGQAPAMVDAQPPRAVVARPRPRSVRAPSLWAVPPGQASGGWPVVESRTTVPIRHGQRRYLRLLGRADDSCHPATRFDNGTLPCADREHEAGAASEVGRWQ
ncbi:MMPL family transporter [Frankia sp. AgB1.9]|uniref:MMPL family transporter n=1 Tax=unclassified Frankia TaxID=2632575 RepID=UPI001932C43A|nr:MULTISPECIES: MMPL family transporter [unclassified Frankia]MBL7494607.1 MMPL family transporter [Frankia sp. AgW1.1]MBL7553795.1 MMPL family transporter [Frankia sp. AgB1.9]MBL7617894.1 MMPL family transporter [Frankia sp. AgB1.8]